MRSYCIFRTININMCICCCVICCLKTSNKHRSSKQCHVWNNNTFCVTTFVTFNTFIVKVTTFLRNYTIYMLKRESLSRLCWNVLSLNGLWDVFKKSHNVLHFTYLFWECIFIHIGTMQILNSRIKMHKLQSWIFFFSDNENPELFTVKQIKYFTKTKNIQLYFFN